MISDKSNHEYDEYAIFVSQYCETDNCRDCENKIRCEGDFRCEGDYEVRSLWECLMVWLRNYLLRCSHVRLGSVVCCTRFQTVCIITSDCLWGCVLRSWSVASTRVSDTVRLPSDYPQKDDIEEGLQVLEIRERQSFSLSKVLILAKRISQDTFQTILTLVVSVSWNPSSVYSLCTWDLIHSSESRNYLGTLSESLSSSSTLPWSEINLGPREDRSSSCFSEGFCIHCISIWISMFWDDFPRGNSILLGFCGLTGLVLPMIGVISIIPMRTEMILSGWMLPSCDDLNCPPETGRLGMCLEGSAKRRIFAIGNYVNQRLWHCLIMKGTFVLTRSTGMFFLRLKSSSLKHIHAMSFSFWIVSVFVWS